jgi:hypothetical protein
MAATLADRLKEQRRKHFVGRMEEKALFMDALQSSQLPFLLYYGYGPGGVGKTSLMREFSAITQDLQVDSYNIDARFVPPNPESCEMALRQVTGTTSSSDARKALGEKRSVLFFDTFELLQPLEGWFREEFLPSMPDTLLTVVMGRKKPSNQWISDSAWSKLAKVIGLRNLSEDEGRSYLTTQEIPEDQHDSLLNFTHGHPLALSLVCEALGQNKGLKFSPQANPDIINLLLERFMDDCPSPLHRQALEASAMLRNTTEAMIASVVDSTQSFQLFEWLKTLTFMESGPFGIYPHDLARDAIAIELKWRNPDDLAKLHTSARTYYADHLERTTGIAQQAILADYIYLHRENPVLKPFFNWNLSSSYVDSAKPEDHLEIEQIVERYEGKESAKIAKMWLASPATHVQVLRDSQQTGVPGFLITIDAMSATPEEIQKDPAMQACLKYLEANAPLRQGEQAFVYRYWMAREGYQQVSPDQSLLFVAVISTSITTPNLAHTFQVCADPEFYGPMFDYASVRRVKEADFNVSGRTYGVFGHDWRVLPLKAWLAVLSERELPIAGAPAPTVKLDDVVVLSQSNFESAVLQALKSFNNLARLSENPLLKSRIVQDRIQPDADSKAKIQALRNVTFEQANSLTASSKDAKLYQALNTSYFKPARSQEVAAEQLDVSIASYRRHLKAGVQRVVELLWQIETGG